MLPVVASLAALLLSSAPVQVVGEGVEVAGAGRLVLTTVSRGGSTCRTQLREVQVVAQELVLTRDCDIVESWLERAVGAEQQLVITRRPVGHGDLRLHLAIADAWRMRDREGHRFGGPGAPGWTYGDAFVVRGHTRRAIETQRVAGGLELVVPEAWLDEPGAFPLHIDPLVQGVAFELSPASTNQQAGSPAGAAQPAVALFPDGTVFTVWVDRRRESQGRQIGDLFGAWHLPDAGRLDFALTDAWYKHDPHLLAVDGGALLYYEDFSSPGDHSAVFMWVPYGASTFSFKVRDVAPAYGPSAAVIGGELILGHSFNGNFELWRTDGGPYATHPLPYGNGHASALTAMGSGYVFAVASDAGLAVRTVAPDAGNSSTYFVRAVSPHLTATSPTTFDLSFGELSVNGPRASNISFTLFNNFSLQTNTYLDEESGHSIMAGPTRIFASRNPLTNTLLLRSPLGDAGIPGVAAFGATSGDTTAALAWLVDTGVNRQVKTVKLSSTMVTDAPRQSLTLQQPLRRSARVAGRNGRGVVAWLEGQSVRAANVVLNATGVASLTNVRTIATPNAPIAALDVAIDDVGTTFVAWATPSSLEYAWQVVNSAELLGSATGPLRTLKLRVEPTADGFAVFSLAAGSERVSRRDFTLAMAGVGTEQPLAPVSVLDFDVGCDAGCSVVAAEGGSVPGVRLVYPWGTNFIPNAQPPLAVTAWGTDPLVGYVLNGNFVAHTQQGDVPYSIGFPIAVESVLARPDVGVMGTIRRDFRDAYDQVFLGQPDLSDKFNDAWSPDMALLDDRHGLLVMTRDSNFSTTVVGVPFTVIDAGVDGGTDAGQPDASVPDASVPDASVPDASVPDASVPDAGANDAGSFSDGGVAPPADGGVEPPDLSASGCNCASADALAFALALMLLRRRR